MRIITVGTLKGGTGKTTAVFNLGGILAKTNKILFIDVDPQCNLSLDVGIDVTKQGLITVKDIFEKNVNLSKAIYKNPVAELPNLDIIPSSIRLTETELNIINTAGREQILSNFLTDNKNFLSKYDYIIIDTNPSMSIINQNAFLAAESIVLISDVSLNGIQGAELFIALWENARSKLKKADNVKALIINNYDKRINLSHELLEYCQENESVKNLLIETIIPSSVKIKETELMHKPTGNPILQKIFYNIIRELKERGVL